MDIGCFCVDCVGGEFTTGTRKNFMNCTQIMKHLKVDGRKYVYCVGDMHLSTLVLEGCISQYITVMH